MVVISSEHGTRTEFLSPDVVLIEAANHGFLYDRMRGGGFVVDFPTSAALSNLLAQGSTPPSDQRVSFDGANWQPILELLRARGFLWSRPEAPTDDRLDPAKVASGAFAHHMSLMVAVECNFACKNCFVFNQEANLLPHQQAYMTWDVAEEALRRFFEMRSSRSLADQSVVRIFGGEPFLNWRLIVNTVRWVRSRGLGSRIYITTNGSLLSRERARFLERNGVTLFISLNGVRAVNDAVRVDHAGRSTFERSLKGLKAQLLEGKQTHVSMTVRDDDGILRLREFVDLLDQLRPDRSRAIVVYLSLMKGLVEETRFRLPEEELAKRLASDWLTAAEQNIYFGGRMFQCFRNVFKTPEKFDRWCERGAGVVVYPKGEIRPCSGSSHSLGHLSEFSEVIAGERFRLVSTRVGGRIHGCRGCAVEGLCGGSCACSSRAGLDEYRPGINCTFERLVFRETVKHYLGLHSRTTSAGRPLRVAEP